MMSDPCCPLCKGPHDICLSRYACAHHLAADAQDEVNHRARKVYNNPTADEAIRRAMKGRNQR